MEELLTIVLGSSAMFLGGLFAWVRISKHRCDDALSWACGLTATIGGMVAVNAKMRHGLIGVLLVALLALSATACGSDVDKHIRGTLEWDGETRLANHQIGDGYAAGHDSVTHYGMSGFIYLKEPESVPSGGQLPVVLFSLVFESEKDLYSKEPSEVWITIRNVTKRVEDDGVYYIHDVADRQNYIVNKLTDRSEYRRREYVADLGASSIVVERDMTEEERSWVDSRVLSLLEQIRRNL